MQADAPGGLRGFLRSKAGLAVVTAIALGLVFAVFAYVEAVLAIPAMLLGALALPVWTGHKRVRTIALVGLVVILAASPLVTLVYAQESLVNPGAASSPGVLPFEKGGAVLENATIAPFVGGPSTNFTWSVQLYPRYLGPSLNGTNWKNDTLQLYISTCPGATATFHPTYCPSGYPLMVQDHNFTSSSGPANGTTVTFYRQLSQATIWSWQMALVVQNRSNASNPDLIELSGDPTYNGLEGPIVGGLPTAFGALIFTIYEVSLLYLGVPFYVILLLYWWYKVREARHKRAIKQAAQAMIGATAASGAAGTPAPSSKPPPSSGATAVAELPCPNCGAVVYPGEVKCWKCGGALTPASSPGTPLASAGSPTPPPPDAKP